MTKSTNDKDLGATLWRPGSVDSLEGFDYESRTGGVGQVWVREKLAEKAMASLLSYESLCEKHIIRIRGRDEVTKDWSMKKINSRASPIVFR